MSSMVVKPWIFIWGNIFFIPLIAAMPILIPVKLPGPIVHNIASRFL